MTPEEEQLVEEISWLSKVLGENEERADKESLATSKIPVSFRLLEAILPRGDWDEDDTTDDEISINKQYEYNKKKKKM
jgi:hypothetical protein